jgi:chromosome condensin MukBEF complex kleisin-like MukF subunit
MADTDLKVQRTIHRLAEMRLLLPSGTRTRSGGVAAAYRLGPIATEIVSEYSFVEESEAERLGFVFSRLRVMLSAMRSEIGRRGPRWTKAEWNEQASVLSLIVHDLVRGVERRQRMLDRWHEVTKSRVKSMLSGSSGCVEAVDDCERLMRDTRAAAHELMTVVVEHEGKIRQILSEIADAANGRSRAVVAAAERIESDVSLVSHAIQERFSAWDKFMRGAAEFITTIIRTDPDRVLSRLLSIQVRAFAEEREKDPTGPSPWTIRVAATQPTYRLRDDEPTPSEKRVIAEDGDVGETTIDDITRELEAEIAARIAHFLATEGECTLHRLMEAYAGRSCDELSWLTGIAVTVMTRIGEVVDLPAAGDTSLLIPISTELVAQPLRIVPRKD